MLVLIQDHYEEKKNRFFLLALPTHRFVDSDQFLAAGTSLDQFLKAYVVSVNELHFPYEYLVSFDKLYLLVRHVFFQSYAIKIHSTWSTNFRDIERFS